MTNIQDSLTIGMISSEVGNVFIAHSAPKPIKIRLCKVVEHKIMSKEFRVPFTLIFESPKNVFLVEGNYYLTSESGKMYVMHVTPIVSPGKKQFYQAMYN
ncbi:MAG: hypothetical protein H7833_01900 [Magnetococcus sp. DMHC-1]|nr:hypothetical protein [Magnetococcales bacterium]